VAASIGILLQVLVPDVDRHKWQREYTVAGSKGGAELLTALSAMKKQWTLNRYLYMSYVGRMNMD
jgi:hypothetical protein